MRKNILKFSGNSFAEYLQSVSQVFGVTVENNVIKIPVSQGIGFIKYIEVEEGFGVRYYNFVLDGDLDFNIFYDDDKELIYRVLYVLRDDVASAATNNDAITMYTSEVQVKGSIKKGQHFHRIAIIFNTTWLENNYIEASVRLEQLTRSLIENHMPVIISHKFDRRSDILSMQLARGLTTDSLPLIEIKMSCIILINEFLHKIVKQDGPKVLNEESSHYETILKVEQKITASIAKPLPPVRELATEFNLSPSTLQRHFKLVFGKNLFEYHQEKRMHWAKHQIDNGDKNITQIAYELGFHKVNNFSKAFRKQFHVLPRDLKVKKMSL